MTVTASLLLVLGLSACAGIGESGSPGLSASSSLPDLVHTPVPETMADPALGAGGVEDGVPEEGPLSALAVLNTLEIKGRAPKTGYERSEFGSAWTDSNDVLWGRNSLSTREDILSRDLMSITCKTRPQMPVTPPCVVQSGVLADPYTGTTVDFVRGNKTSTLVPIDHVVSLGDAWQKGAQQLSEAERVNLANDPLNLIATTQATNSAKRDSDAATWLVPNTAFRCSYVSRQIAVKSRYRLWVTQAEHDAMAGVLAQCPGQMAPTDVEAAARTV